MAEHTTQATGRHRKEIMTRAVECTPLKLLRDNFNPKIFKGTTLHPSSLPEDSPLVHKRENWGNVMTGVKGL